MLEDEQEAAVVSCGLFSTPVGLSYGKDKVENTKTCGFAGSSSTKTIWMSFPFARP